MGELGKHGQFAIIPARALDDSRLDGKEKHLHALLVLGTYADKNGWCFPSLSTVGDWLMVSRSTMSEIFHELEQWGYLLIVHRETEEGVHESNKYRIIHDAELPNEFDRSNPEHPVRKAYETKKQDVRKARMVREQGVRDSIAKNVPNVPLNVPINDDNSKTESQTSDIQPCGHPVSKIASDREGTNYCTVCASESANKEFDAMPSASTGMVSREHTAETVDPRLEERKFVNHYAPVFAEIVGRGEAISEDRQAARRAFSKHFDIERMNSRLDAYLRGEVADFQKQEATAFWVVSRLEKDLAKKRVVEDRSEEIKRRALSQ